MHWTMQQRIICGAAISVGMAIFGALLAWLIIPPIVSYMVDQVELHGNGNSPSSINA